MFSFLQKTPSSPSLDPSGLRTFEFKGHAIRDSSKQRDEGISACEKFFSAVIVNLGRGLQVREMTRTCLLCVLCLTPLS